MNKTYAGACLDIPHLLTSKKCKFSCLQSLMQVNNTDAEGRLTLADALVYACNQDVEKIVDLATLTGACRVALGLSIAGVFTPSDDLAKEVLATSEVSGEKLWRMPLEEGYWESMKSGVADMVNTGDRPGGAITAALFLKQVYDCMIFHGELLNVLYLICVAQRLIMIVTQCVGSLSSLSLSHRVMWCFPPFLFIPSLKGKERKTWVVV
ncbi:hypothetical protein I3760_15G150600 [Carya illinoinensis]|nr:hypothetical protein I3760_15G150600 [Carya illinoinensis]